MSTHNDIESTNHHTNMVLIITSEQSSGNIKLLNTIFDVLDEFNKYFKITITISKYSMNNNRPLPQLYVNDKSIITGSHSNISQYIISTLNKFLDADAPVKLAPVNNDITKMTDPRKIAKAAARSPDSLEAFYSNMATSNDKDDDDERTGAPKQQKPEYSARFAQLIGKHVPGLKTKKDNASSSQLGRTINSINNKLKENTNKSETNINKIASDAINEKHARFAKRTTTQSERELPMSSTGQLSEDKDYHRPSTNVQQSENKPMDAKTSALLSKMRKSVKSSGRSNIDFDDMTDAILKSSKTGRD